MGEKICCDPGETPVTWCASNLRRFRRLSRTAMASSEAQQALFKEAVYLGIQPEEFTEKA